tara:strand:- start:13 stop:441 length:429 start_codon:yes stop_codon:yes gene_type:complete
MIIVNSDTSLSAASHKLSEMYAKHKFLRITVKTGKDRSSNYNALSHAWYAQIADELKDDDALGWKCHCKLHIGVPLLRAEDAEFREFYDNAIKGLSYEQKLKVMKYLPVTSLMTNEQFGKYCKEMQSYFDDLDVHLEFINED